MERHPKILKVFIKLGKTVLTDSHNNFEEEFPCLLYVFGRLVVIKVIIHQQFEQRDKLSTYKKPLHIPLKISILRFLSHVEESLNDM